MPAPLKLYGERHTNTNYLTRLIELNLDCTLLPGTAPRYVRTLENLFGGHWLRDQYFRHSYPRTLGWKHSAVDARASRSDANFVTLTKNPYAWLISLHRRPYHQPYETSPPMEAFLRTPWHTLGRENTTGTVADPVALWNLKNASYLQLPEQRTLHLTSESTLLDPVDVIKTLSDRFGYKRSKEFYDYEQSTKKRADRDGDYYRDYYLNERWRAELSDQAIAIISAGLDPALMERFGYELL